LHGLPGVRRGRPTHLELMIAVAGASMHAAVESVAFELQQQAASY
jgi:hypothetical protein